jgi:hypothetical protein
MALAPRGGGVVGVDWPHGPKGGGAAGVDWPRGPGSLSGVWTPADIDRSMDRDVTRLRVLTVDGAPIPLGPEALKEQQAAAEAARQGHPRPSLQSQCLPAGFPQMMFGSGLPHQTLESPGQVTMLVEELSYFRVIRLNTPQDPDPDPALMGNSVGHWEGDTLVVDTVGLDTRTMLPGGVPHSDAAHVVERYHRISKDRIEILMTAEDPKMGTKPYTIVQHLKLEPSRRISEYFCVNNRNRTVNGATGAILQGNGK